RDGLGGYRRLLFEQEWRNVANNYNPKIKATVELNGTNSAWHTCVTRGAVILTESHVSEIGSLPPFANFRKQLAKPKRGLYDAQEQKRPPGSRVYGILQYMIDDNRRLPIAADIVFPDYEYKELFEQRIKLF